MLPFKRDLTTSKMTLTWALTEMTQNTYYPTQRQSG